MALSSAERARLKGLVWQDLAGAIITGATIDIADNGDISLQEVCLRTEHEDVVAINLADDAREMVLRVDDTPKGWRRVSVDRDYDEELWEDVE